MSWPRRAGELTAAQAATVAAMVTAYGVQPATWYNGQIAAADTPTITADGDLSTATDQVPIKWWAIINADDDVDAAQRFLNGGPNIIEILLGAEQQPQLLNSSGVAQTITTIYAICVSSAAAPADYTGGAYIMSHLEASLTNVLTNMARFDVSSGLGATVARLIASPAYSTYYSQLSVAAGVI